MKEVFNWQRMSLKELSRTSPLVTIFFICLTLIILGIVITALKVLIWVGLIVLFVYIVYFIVWLKNSM
ncbi:MAG: hypothetical protein AABX07_02820 [Nanoarchaeota archaeon]